MRALARILAHLVITLLFVQNDALSPVVVDVDVESDETLVTMRTSSSRSVRLKDVTPIFDSLGIEIISFSASKAFELHESRFSLTDADGRKLQASSVNQLLDALERDLPWQVERSPSTVATSRAQQVQLLDHADSAPAPSSATDTSPDSLAFHKRNKTVSWSLEPPLDPLLPLPQMPTDGPSISEAPTAAEPAASGMSSAGGIEPTPSMAESATTGRYTTGGIDIVGPTPSTSNELSTMSTSLSSNSTAPLQPSVQPQQHRSSGGGGSNGCGGDEECDEALWGGGICPEDHVDRIMSRPVRWIAKEADLGQAKSLMTLWGISALMVDTGEEEPGEGDDTGEEEPGEGDDGGGSRGEGGST